MGAAMIAQAASTALQAVEYFGGTTTTTNSNTKASSTGSTASQTSGETVNSADPTVIAMMKSLAGTAIDNANNAGTIDHGIISSFLKQATDAMTSVFGQQNQSGIYSGATAQVINNDTMARASADAVAAINTYQQGQQGVATSALQDLLTATATQSATGSAAGQTSSNSQSASQSTSKTKASLICTWMFKNELLPRDQYIAVTREFKKMDWRRKLAYTQFASILIRELDRNRASPISKATMALFTSRTRLVCAKAGVAGLEEKLSGHLAAWTVLLLVSPFYFRLLFSNAAGYILARYSHILTRVI